MLGALLLDPRPLGAFARSLREVYPDEVDHLARVVTQALESDLSEAEQRSMGAQAGHDVRRRHADGLLQAGDAHVIAYLDTYLELLDLLADRPDECATMIREGVPALPLATQERLAPRMGEMSEVQLQAMAQGERSPVGRTVSPEAMHEARRRVGGRLSADQLRALTDQTRDAPLCDAMRALMRELIADEGPDAAALRADFAWQAASS
ncbi:hypothetical protein [uncultured Albimonas sp.]|uniref:hypothetical protein n=1 Tax=uncultured Albimonas sp. TaxID=1331701 RepID=UPI0030EEA99E